MKLSEGIYIILALMGLIAVVAIPIAIDQSSSAAVPMWSAAVSPGPLSEAHAFLNNKCESCHAPNRGITAAKCVTCHAPARELLMNPVTAFHAHLNDCRGCHAEHQGRNVRPTHMDHTVLEKIALQTTGHPVALNCQSCHTFQDKHREFFGKECSACHSQKTWKIPGYLHPSPASTNCSECHKAPPSHRMMHFEMVDQSITERKEARLDQCYMCHQTDSFNNIKGVGWFKMH